MRRKKQMDGASEAGWLATYSDTVTLLMCFFVLLYSMSSIDENKYEMIVKSLNPDAVKHIVAGDGNKTITESEQEAIDEEFAEIYEQLRKYIRENKLENVIEAGKSPDFAFITFKNSVLFDGDQYILKDDGKKILNDIAGALGEINDAVFEIQILGHTSQGRPDEVNNVEFDRFLSSNRATEVLVFLQKKNIVEPYKLVAMGYGQHRPIRPFETAEDRAKNRRVEVIFKKKRINDNADTVREYYRIMYKDDPYVLEMLKKQTK